MQTAIWKVNKGEQGKSLVRLNMYQNMYILKHHITHASRFMRPACTKYNKNIQKHKILIKHMWFQTNNCRLLNNR